MTGKKILFVIGTLDIGGTEKQLLKLISGLRDRHWQVAILVVSPGGSLTSKVEQSGAIILSPYDLAGLPILREVRFLRRALNALGAFSRLLTYLRESPDIILHMFLPSAYILGGIASLPYANVKKIMSRRSLNNYLHSRPVVRNIERILHGKMDLLIGNSKAITVELAEEGARPEKVRLIYNGVEVHPFRAEGAKKTETKNSRLMLSGCVITVVANLKPYKGHKYLLESLASVSRRLPENWRCQFVGRDDGIGASLLNFAAGLGISENIFLTGERLDIDSVLEETDIFVSSSSEEGFSNAVLEAMSRKLPVVATAVGGNLEAVIHGKTGLLVPLDSFQCFGAAILRLALNGQLRKRFGDAGYSRVVKNYGIERLIDEHERAYCELLADV